MGGQIQRLETKMYLIFNTLSYKKIQQHKNKNSIATLSHRDSVELVQKLLQLKRKAIVYIFRFDLLKLKDKSKGLVGKNDPLTLFLVSQNLGGIRK